MTVILPDDCTLHINTSHMLLSCMKFAAEIAMVVNLFGFALENQGISKGVIIRWVIGNFYFCENRETQQVSNGVIY
jgi:hypothetical protein